LALIANHFARRMLGCGPSWRRERNWHLTFSA
jgi:hypothetical protein